MIFIFDCHLQPTLLSDYCLHAQILDLFFSNILFYSGTWVSIILRNLLLLEVLAVRIGSCFLVYSIGSNIVKSFHLIIMLSKATLMGLHDLILFLWTFNSISSLIFCCS